MRSLITKATFELWPFDIGHVALMKTLSPPQLPAGDRSTTLRRYGLRIQYDPNTYIGRFLHYRRLFEGQILRSIEEHLQPGATFVDVGGNIGLHTLVASKVVGPQGRVISFEPGSTMRARLLRNIDINGLKNVDVRPYALSREPGELKLYVINERNDGQSTLAQPDHECRSETVQVRTLDEQLRDVSGHCVLKIDVEGWEMSVLEGAREFISRVRPRAIFVECIDAYLKRAGSSGSAVFRYLLDAGYELKALRRGSWVPVSEPVDCDLIATPRKGSA